ncbi:hypothetical protein GCM10011490_10350 [Pseudoclavibacter endophyticus]|uniref:DUF4031 domain-containing protein n=1 Tax=Pseudoclavibacter endophyticus TaxID=1778590 RepID=A0A6H9WK02_9MICO|nr:DUF4031 domain-containing protein [Pseudoclavibacter endophyticus]KAB1649523.1 DUF4031 domain-containing protein [Pseudoclavibacter endophyticus]GGA61932.1 hypothetical protein GCM10011490_10350 [Pseudoclavibacter endophyticus]
MSILIDPPAWPAHGTRWSHLVSDTSYEELHTFAHRLGVSRRAFDLDHYDVVADLHEAAIAAGAIPVASRELVSRLAASGLRVAPVDRPRAYATRRTSWLRADWASIAPRVGVTGAAAAAGAADEADAVDPPAGSDELDLPRAWASLGELLLARWAEPHRHYHDDVHLHDVLLALDQLADAGATVSPEVRLAAWFHDAVYDGRPGDDERTSAALARTALADAGLEPGTVDEVERLVLATLPGAAAPSEADANAATLLDADLSIFAAGHKRYRDYAVAVRAEYAHVPEADFRAGRVSILRSYRDRPRIYTTSIARHQWEARARRNLEAEIAGLEGRHGAAG